MTLLLDTCVFLWLALNIKRVSNVVLNLFQNPDSDILVSPVSLWEITLKYKLGKLHFEDTPQKVMETLCSNRGIAWLDFIHADAFEQLAMPMLHRDPFDRMLVAQARRRGLTLVTPDTLLARYGVDVLW